MRRAMVLAMLCLSACPALSQPAPPVSSPIYGAAVQVSNGKPVPTVPELAAVLRPGDMVRDVLGWQKADPHCDLLGNPKNTLRIPAPLAALYANVAAAQGRNLVTLAFNNTGCGQAASSGTTAFPDTPALRAEFAAYAVGVVRQIPALGAVSIWNELNGTWSGGLGKEPQRLKAYCLLTNTVITEIRKVDPKIPIIIGAAQGWDVDGWFIDMFDKYGCAGKGDPTIWLDVHPYLNGKTVPGTHKTDFAMWQGVVSNIRNDGISNPLFATEWGGHASHVWAVKHPNGNYMNTFKSQVFAQDPNWAGGTWFEMLYDGRFPFASLFDNQGALTPVGARYVSEFRGH